MSDSLFSATTNLGEIKLGPAAAYDAPIRNVYVNLITKCRSVGQTVTIFGNPGILGKLLLLNGIPVHADPSLNFDKYDGTFKVVFAVLTTLTYEDRAKCHFHDVSVVADGQFKVPTYITGDNFEIQQAIVQARLEIANLGASISKWEIKNDRTLRIEWRDGVHSVITPLVFKKDKFRLAISQFVTRVQTHMIATMKEQAVMFFNEAELFMPAEEPLPAFIPLSPYVPNQYAIASMVNLMPQPIVFPIKPPTNNVTGIDANVPISSSLPVSLGNVQVSPISVPAVNNNTVQVVETSTLLSVVTKTEEELRDNTRLDNARYLKKLNTVDVVDDVEQESGVFLYLDAAYDQEVPQNSVVPTTKVLYYREKKTKITFSLTQLDGRPIECAKHTYSFSPYGGRVNFMKCKGAECGSKRPLPVVLTIATHEGISKYYLQLVTSRKLRRNSILHKMVAKVNGTVEVGEEVEFRLRKKIDTVLVAEPQPLGLKYEVYGYEKKKTYYSVRFQVSESTCDARMDIAFYAEGKLLETTNVRLSMGKQRGLSFGIPDQGMPLLSILDRLDPQPDYYHFVTRETGGVYFFYYFEAEKIKKNLMLYHELFGICGVQYEYQVNFSEDKKPIILRM